MRNRSLLKRTVPAAATALLAALVAAPAPAQAASSGRSGEESTPVYSYDRAVRETVYVETGKDSDGDGRTDRVAVDIIRPREAAEQGRKVPVIMNASPYFQSIGRGPESQVKTYDEQGKPLQFPLYYDNYFVPRGYAVALVDQPGTNRSDGCSDAGGPSDIAAAKSVVDWFNGRARGYTSRTGDGGTDAGWTTGSVGLIGKSYDGSIANGLAATGVDGLKTVVPISGPSSWYDYYFYKGASTNSTEGIAGHARYVETDEVKARCKAMDRALVEGSPRDGNWTGMWQDRDYVRGADKVRASVFAVHGLQDLNVRTQHLNRWWDALAENGVERKIWLSTAAHTDPFEFRRQEWVTTLHRWFDHYLMGYDNGVEREPMADVERAPGQWTTDPVWPPSGTGRATVRPAAGPVAGVGTLGTEPAKAGATAEFTDDPALGELDWAADADRPTPAKAAFTTRPLHRDLRLSGHGSVTLKVTPTTNSATLSAVLVDLGPDTIRDYKNGGGVSVLPEKECFGSGTAGDTGCFKKAVPATKKVEQTVFSRGWADLGHYAGFPRREITPGKQYDITLDLGTADHVVPAGHRLALIVAGTDKPYIDAPASTPKLTVDLAGSAADLPVVGGYRTFARATGDDRT
ncbi:MULTISPECIES: Xaa-Pro dipeptidyl-peptidase [Streptomyces]|uniref:Xaa-Pro dipeptidyl-peptidase n=1 Tax=Streptomyces TaxID=1883 RepID=UPI00163B884D|nr:MULTISPECIES: Xaa-Pro dipeptidyl-peptidase [Streptomyces]MBC2876868.1 Xaa-Pro dipeptidyl-peptidase [Streptomyces sp. TYQ1024]UBI35899.1 Xaa-Pro dipeptidyl-peptidase [Streptomyces mobaraensis]UKW28493.1 Xaa-Pro dipeptidyl-peptidase [Streptomyces sp. TYQ1024]